MASDGAILAEAVDLLVRLALEVHPGLSAAKEFRQIPADRLLVRTELRALEDDRYIEIADRKAVGLHPANGFFDENPRIGGLPVRVCVGEELADVRLAQRATDRVRDGVIDHIAITMRRAAAVVLKADPADDQREAGFQPVQIETVADAELGL